MKRSFAGILAVALVTAIVFMAGPATADRGGWPDPPNGWDIIFDGNYADVLAMQADGWYMSNTSGEPGTDGDYTTWGDWDLNDTQFLTIPGQGEIENGVPSADALIFQLTDDDTAGDGVVRRFKVGKPFDGTYDTTTGNIVAVEGGVTMIARFRVTPGSLNEPDADERCYRADALFAVDASDGGADCAGLAIGNDLAKWAADDDTLSTNIETGDLTNAFHTFYAVIEPHPQGDPNNWMGTLYVDGSMTPIAPSMHGPGDMGANGIQPPDNTDENWFNDGDRFSKTTFPALAGKAMAMFGGGRSAAMIEIQYDYICWKKGAFHPGVAPAEATVSRSVDTTYTPGGQATITLTAHPLAPTAIDVTETLPAGWTVVSATPSAGTATPSGNTVNWTANLNATDETLVYVVQAPGTACGSSLVTGTFTAGGPGTVSGDQFIDQAPDSLNLSPIAWSGDIDIPSTLTAQGRTDYFACNGAYRVWGAGADIWNNFDEFHFLYVMVNGDCAAVADVEHLAPEVNGWEKAGVMIRANLTQGSPHVMCVLRSTNTNIYCQERVDQDGGSQRFTGVGSDLANFPASSEMNNNGVGRVFIARNGSAIVTGGDDLEGNDWITQQWLTADRPNLSADPVYVGLCFTSHASSATIERAQFTNVNITGNIVSTTPSDPSNLTAQTWGSGGIRLDWTDNSNNEQGFKIERKEGAGGTYAEIAQTTANATLFIDTGLTVGTEYFYRIRAFNLSGDSGYSNEASAIPVVVLGAREWPLYK